MSKYVINDSTLVAIGDAVREKDGTTAPIIVSDLASRIKAIPQEGGGGAELPEEAFRVTGDCSYKFANGGWDWYINTFGDRITTSDITQLSNMFAYSKVESIPFDLNCKYISYSKASLSYLFTGCNNLKELPKLTFDAKASIPTASYNFIDCSSFFNACYNLRYIPDDYLTSFVVDGYWEARETLKAAGQRGMIENCFSLRKVPAFLPKVFKNCQTSNSIYSSYYYGLFKNCHNLEELVLDIEYVKYTQNAFVNSFQDCARAKRLIFKTNEDGSPIEVEWKNQQLNIETVGYAASSRVKNNLLKYNTGVSNFISDATQYQEYKEDEFFCTDNIDYSRYNHDSAVETINSLPDVSAGSGNVISFKGGIGALTDGGAINTMTEEEIAVAAAKGWTVTFA